MIAYATYHAQKPLPACGVTLAALLFPQIYEVRHAQKINPMGKHIDGRTKESGEMFGASMHSDKSSAARVKRYRPVMIGQGQMSIADLYASTGICAASIRQRMIALEDTGHVCRHTSSGAVFYRWIGD